MKEELKKNAREESGDSYLDVMHFEGEMLRDVSRELCFLGEAFYSTGNDKIGEQLINIATDISKAERNISKAVGKEVHDRCQASQAETGKILSLALNNILDSSKSLSESIN